MSSSPPGGSLAPSGGPTTARASPQHMAIPCGRSNAARSTRSTLFDTGFNIREDMTLRLVQGLLLGLWCALPWFASKFLLAQKWSWHRRQDGVRLIWAVWLTSTLLIALPFGRG